MDGPLSQNFGKMPHCILFVCICFIGGLARHPEYISYTMAAMQYYGGKKPGTARRESTTTCSLPSDLPIYDRKGSQTELDLNSHRPPRI